MIVVALSRLEIYLIKKKVGRLCDEQILNINVIDDVICLVENAIQIIPPYPYVCMYFSE